MACASRRTGGSTSSCRKTLRKTSACRKTLRKTSARALQTDDSLDLDLHPGHHQRPHSDERAGGPGVAEELLPHWVDLGAVGDVGEIDRDPQHILETRVGGRED